MSMSRRHLEDVHIPGSDRDEAMRVVGSVPHKR